MDTAVNIWYFMVGPLAVNVFLFGLAWNLRVFRKYKLPFDQVLDLRPEEVPSALAVACFAALLLSLQTALFVVEAWRRGSDFGVSEFRMEVMLITYCIGAGMLLLCPFDVLHRRARFFLLRRLANCMWPFDKSSLPTPFVEVFVADGLTSLSKFLQDVSVAVLLLAHTFNQEDPALLRDAYQSKMKHYVLPYLVAGAPYVMRAVQCILSFQRTNNSNDRFLHLLNTIKYMSSLVVIFVGAAPQVSTFISDNSTLFLCAAVFNSLYSFLWDVVMDWGLGQPRLPSKVKFLRRKLVYKQSTKYYMAIAVDFALRIVWASKWWDWTHLGVDFKMVSQVAEVVRRVLWNVFRVEWQCIREGDGKKSSRDEDEESLTTQTLSSSDEEERTSRDDASEEDLDVIARRHQANDEREMRAKYRKRSMSPERIEDETTRNEPSTIVV